MPERQASYVIGFGPAALRRYWLGSKQTNSIKSLLLIKARRYATREQAAKAIVRNNLGGPDTHILDFDEEVALFWANRR